MYVWKQKPKVSHDCKVALTMLHQTHSGALMTGVVQIGGEWDKCCIKGVMITSSLASKQAAHKGTQTCDACSLTVKHTLQHGC